jgi:diacylglycerol kinase (ATP)
MTELGRDSDTQPTQRAGLWRRLREVLPFKKPAGRISIILNPASGHTSPILKTFNRVFHDAGYHWEIRITNQFGDGQRHAQKAIEEGADIIAVYGGDGSIMDVASGMVGSSIPLAILPGGTGNALASEFNLPRSLGDAWALAIKPQHKIRPVDLGSTNGTCFMLRAGIGLEAAIVKGAPRDAIDRFGVLAYALASIQALNESKPSLFQMQIDGNEIEMTGQACMIANAASLGIPGMVLSPRVNISDGLLDVFIIRKADLSGLLAIATNVVVRTEDPNIFPHWQGAVIKINADPVQDIESDGELIGLTPAIIEVLPSAVNVIVA